jgi:hypothetical protein
MHRVERRLRRLLNTFSTGFAIVSAFSSLRRWALRHNVRVHWSASSEGAGAPLRECYELLKF